MISRNTTQQYAHNQSRHSLANAAEYRQSSAALFGHHWICSGCGMAHARILPEECASCGATALEFEYTARSEKKIHPANM